MADFLTDLLAGKPIPFSSGSLTITYKKDANALSISGDATLNEANAGLLQTILSILKQSKQIEKELAG